MRRWVNMVQAALKLRTGWRRLSTLSAERGEPWRPIDVETFLVECATSGRQSMTLFADCHRSAIAAKVARR